MIIWVPDRKSLTSGVVSPLDTRRIQRLSSMLPAWRPHSVSRPTTQLRNASVGTVRILLREYDLVAVAVQTDRQGVLEEQPSVQQALGVRRAPSLVPVPGLRHGVEPSAGHARQPRRDHLGIAEAHVRRPVLDAQRLPHGVGGGLVDVADAGVDLGDDLVDRDEDGYLLQ